MPECPDPSGEVVQSLWIGGALSPLEQLSIRSFLAHGHPYHLYTYEDLEGVQPGVVLRDANEILPLASNFYRNRKSLAGFSDVFRYKLLFERGGWWSDLDAICLQPFCFQTEHVFSTEHRSSEDMTEVVNTGNIRAPAGSAAMKLAWEKCCNQDLAALKWGDSGPRLLQEVVLELSLSNFVKPARTFCPIPYYLWFDVITPGRPWDPGDDTYAVHFWNDMWRRNGIDKHDAYPPNCLFERLKREYLIPATAKVAESD
jgi:hypothetical protein